ncbi:hypothetical protein KVT40_009307 [Elsinoe batatas]|uniref:Uncharacterized protein n=1 Tax=Elsinoe batatas TaxID=2601811 RepID=A0A8K0KS09_9PEZI|nr:hypothetical protein KVT40_009307 [Elsinoe batatas]
MRLNEILLLITAGVALAAPMEYSKDISKYHSKRDNLEAMTRGGIFYKDKRDEDAILEAMTRGGTFYKEKRDENAALESMTRGGTFNKEKRDEDAAVEAMTRGGT